MATTSSSRRGRKRRLKADINVVPYIDVMLVLLIIFMVTAPLLNLGVDVSLPQSNAKSIQDRKDPIIVRVDRSGNYALILQGGQPQELPADMLEAKVKALVANNPDLPVFVAGDREANYEVVLDAMALLQHAGVEKVGLMSQPVGSAAK
jgi:biopolymer transport protein TolR